MIILVKHAMYTWKCQNIIVINYRLNKLWQFNNLSAQINIHNVSVKYRILKVLNVLKIKYDDTLPSKVCK